MDVKQSGWKWWRMDAAGLCVGIAVTSVGYFGAIDPLIKSQEQQELQLLQLSAQNEKAAQSMSSIAALKRQLAKLQQEAETSPLQLQSSQLSNQRLAALTGLASANGLQVDELRTGTITAAPHFEIVPIHLSGRGAFQTSAAFLAKLHAQFPDMGLTAMALSDNPADESVQTSLKLELVWYAAPALTSAAD